MPRWLVGGVAASVVVVSAPLVGALPAAAAGPAITVTKTGPASVLAGGSPTFTITAANPSSNASAVPEYNTSLRDVLPVGLTYQAGSTTPADAGEPTIITNGATGQQTLIWSDLFDLQPGGSDGITFSTTVNDATLPVGSTITNTGYAYASSAPRYVPKFDATGAPVASANVQSATSAATTTTVSALAVTKAEPSPESKLLRGVHTHPTTYTLTVTNTGTAATTGVTVVDYLPASQEFLGCGGVDNTSGGAVEYPGAPRLTATSPPTGSCPTPATVDTVTNPPGHPAGVYTQVTWNVGTLAAGQSATIEYRAGIPLRANVAFNGGPSAASLGQTANLDNNTGASTRQNGSAAASVNSVTATGSYTGNVASGTSRTVTASADHTVTINDLRIYKSVSPTQFQGGGVATYTLHVDASEYADSSAITITDVLPNGICPLDNVANHVTGAPAECDPAIGFAPSLPYQSVTQNADGTFTVVFLPIVVPHDGSMTITYQGRMRTSYTGGGLAGNPTSAGDAFTNNATEQGTSTPVAATGYTGTLPVTDPTSATQTTAFGSLSKTVGARVTPMTCGSATYGTTNPTFVKGDRVCFQVTAPFSTTNQTRNPVLTDFLPDNTAYEVGSVTYPAANTVPGSQIAFDGTGGNLTWTLGAANADGSKEVAAGSVFVAQFSVLILDAASGPAPDKPGNIVKLRAENSSGQATSLRDQANFQVAAAPPLGITKGVASVDGGPTNPANTDHVQVHEGSSVVFRVDLTNNGSAANLNAVPVDNIKVWDVLPAGITCTAVSSISDNGTCTNPGDAGQPSFAGNATRSAVVWTSAAALAAGASRTLTYAVLIPTPTSVSADLVNTASVRSYDSTTDLGSAQTYYPAANVDTSVPPTSYDAPAASDVTDVYLADVAVTKGVTSTISEAGNIGNEATPQPGTQATIGEQVAFTVTARVPAHSTVYNGSFSDPLPTGLTLLTSGVSYQPDAASATTSPLPAGVTFSGAAPSTLSFPATYDNTTATDQLYTIVINAQMAQVGSNQNGVVRKNTATFASSTAATGGTALPARTASATVTDVEPQPSLTKTNSAGGPVAGGQTVTYTLKPSNSAGRPPLHDAWQLDCLPSGLTFAAYGSVPGAVTTVAPVAGNGSNGCPAGYTVLSWNLGDLAGSLTLTYTATVDPGSSGKQSYVNVASVSGNSLAGARTSPVDPGNPNGRQYSASANSTVTVAGATVTKSVTPTSAPVGGTVTYTVGAKVPANVNFYNLSIIDTLPRGIDPASVQQQSITCANADSTACSLTSSTPLTPAASGTSTVVGWLIGDATQSNQARTVTITYTARIADVSAATRGAVLTNAAHVAWNNAVGTPPTSAGATFNQSSPNATAPVTVTEPTLNLGKSVSTPSPQPGGSPFTYSLLVTNPGGTNVGTAYNVAVRDQVPTGVVVDPASISGGGTITGTDANGSGRTITWTVPSLAATASTTFSYRATLAPSATLTGASLTNTASVTGYDSLASGGRHYTGPTSTATVTPAFPRVVTTKSTPAGSTAFIGSSFPWQITATNTGGATGQQVGIVDTLPANWTYDSGSAQVSVNGGSPTQVEPTTSTNGSGVQTLTWTSLGTLPPGSSLVITFTATPGPSITANPGIGLSVNQLNSATSSIQDLSGATGNAAGSYSAGPGTAAAHVGSADLSLAKAVGTAPTAGGSGSWTLTVANSGPDAASGPFTVTDGFNNPLPTGITSTSAGGTGWSCSTAAPITCTRTSSADTLASGASFPAITVTYAVASSVPSGTSLTNSATVGARTYDPQPANNTGSAGTSVSTSADISVSKTLSSPQLVAGQNATYGISVGNAGPSSAAGPVVVSDPLPAGAAFVSVSAPGWTCDPIAAGTVGATLSCRLGDGTSSLAVGEVPQAISVTVTIPSSQTAAVRNTATVGSATTDPSTANNTSTVTTTPTVLSDVSIQKRHVTTTFVAGQDADYSIVVADNGPSDATGVAVTDILPAGLGYVSATGTGWTCSATGQQVTCSYAGSLAAGAPSTIALRVHLDPTFTGSAMNTATVTSTSTDTVPGNNSSTDNSSVNTSADLSVTKTHGGGTVTAGDPLTYTLSVHNAGPSAVAGTVTVTDPLPVGLTFDSASGAACTYAGATRTVTCTIAGLADGATAPDITIATTVQSSVGPSTLTNTATVSSDVSDPDQTNNAGSDDVQVVTSAGLSLAKTLTRATPVLAGTDATFALTAASSGPSDSRDVVVTDTLPQYLSYSSATGTGWNCSATGQVVTCSRDSITAGTSAPTITLVATVSPSTPVTLPAGTATLTNTATVDQSTPGTITDPDPVGVPVQARADLTLVKTPKNGTATAGSTFSWGIAVANTGPSDAADPITVTDTLPAYETFVGSTGAWACTADAAPSPPAPGTHQTVTCVLQQTLAAGAGAPALTITVLVDGTAPAGAETNTATAGSPTPGAAGTDTATVTVARTAALTVTKTHVGDGQVGQPLDFTLRVHNTGPSAADEVVIDDPLPTGLSFVSASGTGWTCAATGQSVHCTLAGTLAAGADSAELTLTTTVTAGAYPGVSNVATVSSTDPDLPGSSTATDPVVVDPSATLTVRKEHVGTFVVGQPGSYRITVGNTGPTPTPGPVSVTDALPTGLSYVGGAGTGWTCSAVGQVVTCDRDGALDVGDSSTVALTVGVGPAAYPSVVNSATATAPGAEPVSGSDTAPVTPTVALGITKSLVSYTGSAATYRITVTDQGPSATVAPVRVVDHAPAGLRLRSASGTGWVCVVSAGTATCTYAGTLAARASVSLTVVATVTAAAGTRVANTAQVSGGGATRSVTSNAAALTVRTPGSGGGGGSGGFGGLLPKTGAQVLALVELGLLLIFTGVVLQLARRRRS